MSNQNPYRDLLAFGMRIHQEELQRAASLSGERRQDHHERGRRANGLEAELQALTDATLLAAGRTGFSVEEVERRVNALAEPIRAILLWQRDAPVTSPEERAMMEASGVWEDPAAVYLSNHHRRMMGAWNSVHTLAIRADGEKVPPQNTPPELPAAPPKLSRPESRNAVEALLGDDAQQILTIVRSDKSADSRMREICGIDRRFLGYNSTQWAQLLSTSDAAIRKTPFWKQDRQRAIEADRELRGE
jgi:hypothetical protein